jgi:hypothetical protein
VIFQVLASSAKNILLLGYGMTLGFPTIVIPSLQPHHGNVTDLREKDTLSLTEEQISWFSKWLSHNIGVPLAQEVTVSQYISSDGLLSDYLAKKEHPPWKCAYVRDAK